MDNNTLQQAKTDEGEDSNTRALVQLNSIQS